MTTTPPLRRAEIAALYAMAVWIPLQYLPTRHLGLLPHAAVWLDEALLVLLAAAAAIVVAREPRRARLPLNLPLAAFLAVAAVSAIWNRASPQEVVLGLRSAGQFVVLAYVIVILRVPARHLARLAAITVGLAVLQAPFAAYQLAATHSEMSRDLVFGTMWLGASNTLAYFLLLVMLPLAGYWLRRTDRAWPLVCLAAILIPFGFSSSRGAYYALPVVLLIGFGGRLRHDRRLRRLLAGLLAGVAVLVVIFLAVKPSGGSPFGAELAPRRLLAEQLDPQHAMGRIYYLRVLFELFERHGPAALWIGLGPARFNSTAGSYLDAPLLAEVTEGANARVIPSQLISTLSEFGLLGLLAFGWAVARGIWALHEAGRRLEDPGWRGFAEGAVAAGAFMLVGIPLENIWETQHVAYYFWAMVGAGILALERQGARPGEA